MPQVVDQMGRNVVIEGIPKRIISLVPSQSEFLWEAGLSEKICGITKFCIHPGVMFNTLQKVGGTKKLNYETIRALKPDLLIGNKEENSITDIEVLEKEFPVWMSDIVTTGHAVEMMRTLASICDVREAGEKIISDVRASLQSCRSIFQGETVVYAIWNEPMMFAAEQTFIHEVLQHVGFTNALQNSSRYPEVQLEGLKALNPNYIFLSSEPYPFRAAHRQMLQEMLPSSKVILVDGEMFSWYGSRLSKLNDYMQGLREQIYSA